MKVFNRTDLEQNRNDLREFVQIPRKSLIVCIEYMKRVVELFFLLLGHYKKSELSAEM